MTDIWKDPEVIKLYNEIKDLERIIDKRVKDNRLELYNVGEKIHKKQPLFHRCAKRIKAIFGGNRSGKTVAGAVEAVTHALGDSRFRKLKPSSGWVVSLTGDVQRKVAQAEILKWLPKKEIANIIIRHGRKDDLEGSLIDEIRLKNGCFIGFKTCEQGRAAFQGTSLGWCIAEGQRVFMADGTYKPIEEVKAGDVVVTVNDHGDYVNKRVIAAYDKGVRDVIELDTSRFLKLQCTPDHKVYTSLKTKTEGKKAHRIYQARMNWELENPIDKEDAFYVWTGLVLSEGCVPQKKITLGAENVVEKAIMYLPEGAHVRKKEFNNGHVPDWFLNWDDFWSITDNALAYEKFVPDWIFKSSNKKIALFLRYLYAGDGWASNHVIGYASTSKMLAEDVSLLLWRLGIRNSIIEKKPQDDKWRTQWWTMITASEYVKLFIKTVGIEGKEEAMQKTLAIAEERYLSKVRRCSFAKGKSTSPTSKQHNRYAQNRYAAIRGKQDIGKVHVYDLSIEDYHRFFVGTSLVSNCWFDEEPPEDIFKECWMRTMDTRGDIWFTMTPLLGLTWVYFLVYLNENNNQNVDYFEFEWDDNPWLSAEEIAEMELVMDENEREARQFGRFTSLCGFAFPELRKETHIKPIQAIPVWYKKYVSIDYGFDSLAAIWYWVDNYGNARAYKALRKKNLVIHDAAKELLKFTGSDLIEAYYAPPDLWNRRQDTGKSAAQVFYEKGITLVKVSNAREQGWLNVHEWLRPVEKKDEQTGEAYKTAKLTFDEGLDPDLWKHLTTIQKDQKNPNDVATQPHDCTHYPDSIRYFCTSRMVATKQPEEERHYNFECEREQDEKNYYNKALADNFDEEFFNYGG